MDYVKIYQAAAQNSKKLSILLLSLIKFIRKLKIRLLKKNLRKIFITGQFLSIPIISFNHCEIERCKKCT